MAHIEIRNIEKSFGKEKVLHNINLNIKDGEFIVLLGPSGCGKTTLLNIIAGLESQDKGDVIVNNKNINNLPPKDRDVGFVFQNYSLYPNKSVYDNLSFSLKFKNLDSLEFREVLNNGVQSKSKKELTDFIVKAVAETLGISDILHKRPNQLSGGQSQRVAIGRALVRKPQIFLFDEPLSNLDAILRISLREEIKSLHKRLGNTIIYVTHDQSEAMSLADKIVVMNKGLIQQVGTPQEVYTFPKNLFVANFLGNPAINLINAEIIKDESTFQLKAGDRVFHLADSKIQGILKASPNKKIIMGIRPEKIGLKGRENNNQIKLELKEVYREFLGNSVLIRTTLDNFNIQILAEPNETTNSEGKIEAHINSSDLLLFNAQDSQCLN